MAMWTVGFVAGLIAFGIALVSFVLPNVFVLILAGGIRREQSAATWSVLGRQLHRSVWPVVLGSDTSSVAKSPRWVQFWVWLQVAMVACIAIAGVVTPLGLRNEILMDNRPSLSQFQSVNDTGPFGLGTPPRDPDTYYFNRVCFQGGQEPGNCPFSNTKVSYSQNQTGLLGTNRTFWDGTYDIRIPPTTADIYTSLHDEHPSSIAGAFDIQWRQHTYSAYRRYNDGKPYPVGSTRYLTSLLLDDAIEPVEGLVADMQNGGIGFRRHTVPDDAQYGTEWVEELLWVAPETVCVNTNLTLDYQISPLNENGTTSDPLSNLSITDRGGFVNLNRTYPAMEQYPGQEDSFLWFRAYKGAWWNNAWTMLFFNVTNPAGQGGYDKAFRYVDSEIGKKFYINAPIGVAPNRVLMQAGYGQYLPFNGEYNFTTGEWQHSKYSSGSSFTKPDPRTNYTNPWHIARGNFSDGLDLCEGSFGGDPGSVDILDVGCKTLLGAPIRTDSSKSGLRLEPSSWWSQPIYSCATAVKANVKLVTFRYNDTGAQTPLERLKVLDIRDKEYSRDEDRPYWAVEDTKVDVIDYQPLWGIVSSATAKQYGNNANLTIRQSSHIYLPGGLKSYDQASSGLEPSESTNPLQIGNQITNLPVCDAFRKGLAMTSAVSDESRYNGDSSMSLFQKWQDLSRTAESASKIANLIFTDYVANQVTGTRSLLDSRTIVTNLQPKLSRPSDDALSNSSTIYQSQNSVAIYQFRNRIVYQWLYAIPALIVLAVVLLTFITGFILAITRRLPSTKDLRLNLNFTSSGRLLTAIVENRGTVSPYMVQSSTKKWQRAEGSTSMSIESMTTARQSSGSSLTEKTTEEYDRRQYYGKYESLPQTEISVSSQTAAPQQDLGVRS